MPNPTPDQSQLPLAPEASFLQNLEPSAAKGLVGGQNLDAEPATPMAPGVGQSAFAPQPGRIVDEPTNPVDAGNAGTDPALGEQQGNRPKPSRIQERISRLVKKNHQTSNENTVLRDQLSAVSSQLSQLQARIPKQQPAVAPQPSGNEDLFGGAGEAAPASASAPGTPELADQIQAAVKQAIAPLTQSLAARDQIAQIKSQHEMSFQTTAKDYPELRQEDSEFRQTFNALFDGRPDLQQLPDAPAVVAAMVSGLMADKGTAGKQEAARKVAAGVHVPQPSAVDAQPGQAIPKSVQETVAKLNEAVRNGYKPNTQEYRLLRTVANRPK